MNILIKSYNRPYLLHYTLKSIFKNIIGDFNITIVDDGTPDCYLMKIKEEFPSIQINKTIYHAEKSNIILHYEKNIVKTEPIKLPHADWNKIANDFTADYFLVLEDDQFIVKKIDLNKIVKVIKDNELQLLHFNVLNKKFFNFNIVKELNNIYIYNSKFQLSKIKKFNLNFYPSNLFKPVLNILKKFNFKYLQIDFKNDILDLYNIYIISGVIYRKSYWSRCVDSSEDELNEKYQIHCAGNYNLKTNGNLCFGVTKKRHIKTTLNNTSLGLNRGTNFDPTLFNILVNKLWYKNDLNYFDESNYELNVNYISNFLKLMNYPNCTFTEWIKFTGMFENAYKELGFDL